MLVWKGFSIFFVFCYFFVLFCFLVVIIILVTKFSTNIILLQSRQIAYVTFCKFALLLFFPCVITLRRGWRSGAMSQYFRNHGKLEVMIL